MDIPETKAILDRVATYDHRPVTDDLVRSWQYALIRIPIEAAFDAVTDHYDDCASANTVALTPAEILAHVRKTREREDREEAQRRDRQRNEAVFGSLHDHRTEPERAASLTAMRAGRAHLNAVLEQRRAGGFDA